MTATVKLDAVAEALQRLEEQLELPYVPGELHAWGESVRQLLGDAATRLRADISGRHPSIFDSITKSQGNLRQQVDKLKADDEQLLESLASVERLVEQFSTSFDETAQAGQHLQPMRERVINDGLSLVLRARRQRSALDTWHTEALQRDNGVGD